MMDERMSDTSLMEESKPKKVRRARQARASRDDPSSRRMSDRDIANDRARISEDERNFENFKTMGSECRLPTPPPIPGYHYCWLSDTKDGDAIALRSTWGYKPVTKDDVPNWWGTERHTQQGGSFPGCISVNEMYLFKVPVGSYERMMRYLHHERPAEEASRLQSKYDELRNMTDGYADEQYVARGNREKANNFSSHAWGDQLVDPRHRARSQFDLG